MEGGWKWVRDPRGPRHEIGQECDAAGVKFRRRSVVSDVTDLCVDHLRAERSEFDAIAEWINTPECAIDLDAGGKRTPTDDLFMPTRMTACLPSEGEPTRWLAFLERVLPDPEVRAYIQRLCFYLLYGHNREHILAFLYGEGRNGKGVFTRTLAGIMGDYAMTADPDTFMLTRHAQHRQVFARMVGRRLVAIDEIPQGATWNDARIKQCSGGDPIEANFMRENSFEFTPAFTLFISGNHKPRFRGVSTAIRARLHLIPFTEVIPEKEIDPHLDRKIEEEWPQIFRWMLDGGAAYRERGLDAPKAVRDAGREYLDSSDPVGCFMRHRIEYADGAVTTRKTAWQAFLAWAEGAGEPVHGIRQCDLDEALTRRFRRDRGRGGIQFHGLAIPPEEGEADFAAGFGA